MANSNYETGIQALKEHVDRSLEFDGGYPADIQEIGDYVACFQKSNGDYKYREIEFWHKKHIEAMGVIISYADEFFEDEGLTDDFITEVWYKLAGLE